MIVWILQKYFYQNFLKSVSKQKKIISEIKKNNDKSLTKELYRIFHTIKGSASLVNMNNFSKLAHKIEEYLKKRLENEKMPDEKFLDNLIAVISKISNKTKDLTDEELNDLIKTLEGKKIAEEEITISQRDIFMLSEISEFISQTLEIENSVIRNNNKKALAKTKNLKKQLIEIFENIVFVKLENILKDLEELVQREAKKYSKKIKLVQKVRGVKIEKEDVKDILDILVHLIRNSIAHGIETPEERKKNWQR